MDFDSYVVVRVLRPADAPELTDEEAGRIQDAHLANIHAMHRAGQLIAAGPSPGPDPEVRGFALMTTDLDTARGLWSADPAVQAGVFVADVQPWFVPARMITDGGGVPPRSRAEANG